MSSTLPGVAADSEPSPFWAASRQGRTAAGMGFARLYRTFLGARAALGLALASAQGSTYMLGSLPAGWELPLCVLYATAALFQLVLALTRSGPAPNALRATPWWTTVGLDIALFTALAAGGPVTATPVAAMYVLPVMMSSVLSTRRAGLASAAMATLGLLGASLWVGLAATDWGASITQAGLAGIGYFAIAILGAELTARVAREQAAARGNLEVARQQAALNQLVIDEMQEGVLVVDRGLVVRAANPAARVLLGERAWAPPAPFALDGPLAWAGLRTALLGIWKAEQKTLPAELAEPPGQDTVLAFTQAPARTLRLRWRAMPGRAPGGADDLMVVLLEDRATLLARARQEKLAAMGRMSAGIAHEIRNPLAAISQANALLSEDLSGQAAHQRLTALVASNVKRLQRIVDEVMLLAAPADAPPAQTDAAALVSEAAQDWLRTQPGAALGLALPAKPMHVLFDPDHLRRVLVNLLDNGWRHAQSVCPSWVKVELLDEEPPRLCVRNASAPLSAQAQQHLFEPFFSTRSRGSGLGLYICRELCERYGARIDYQSGEYDGQACVLFTVTLRQAQPLP